MLVYDTQLNFLGRFLGISDDSQHPGYGGHVFYVDRAGWISQRPSADVRIYYNRNEQPELARELDDKELASSSVE